MLLDHFHPPLFERRPWSGFHSHWASTLTVDINRQLPDGWFAEPNVQWSIEVDVATYEEAGQLVGAAAASPEDVPWEPPAPDKTIDFDLRTDVVEVRVHNDMPGVPMVGVVEIVSPANKDRPETRDAFVSKCDTFLRDAIGLAMIDIVTNRHANMHSLLVERFGETAPSGEELYAAAYRPMRRDESAELALWYKPLSIGAALPSLPLFLKNGPMVKLNLAETYVQTCRDLKIKLTE